MKKDILKIAGVKSEKEFYAKFPTEEAFMKAHGKEFKKAAMGKSIVNQQLTQLTDFSNPPQADKGLRITPTMGYVNSMIPAQYQFDVYDPYAGNVLNNATRDKKTGLINSGTGQVSKSDTKSLGFKGGTDMSELEGVYSAGKNIFQAFQSIDESIRKRRRAKQQSALLDPVSKAAGLKPDLPENDWLRPEDNMVEADQVANIYGSGYTLLNMKKGGTIGGNPTEIQNMYNPDDLYADLGYGPITSKKTPKALTGLAVAKIAQAAGEIGSGIIDYGTDIIQKGNERRLKEVAFQSGMQGLRQGAFSGFMEDGGYVSNNWQPQLITKFGEYDMKDLLRKDPTMDTLRAGGHLQSYTPPTEKGMKQYAMGGDLQTHWGGSAETISQNPYLPGDGETVMFRGQSHEEADSKGRTGIGITFGENPVEVERGEPAVKLEDGGTGEENLTVFGNMKIPSYALPEIGDPKAKGKKFKHYAADLSKKEKKAERAMNKATDIIDSVSGESDPFSLIAAKTAEAMMKGADMTYADVANTKQILAGIQNAILETAEEMGVESDALAKGKIKPVKDSDMAKFGAKLETAQNGKNKSKISIPDLANSGLYNALTKSEISQVAKYLGVPKDKVEGRMNQIWRQKTAPTAQQLADEDRATRIALGEQPLLPYDSFAGFMKSWAAEHAPEKFNSLTTLPTAAELAQMESRSGQQKETALDKALKLYGMAQPYIRPGIKNPLDPMQTAGELMTLATNQLEPVQTQLYTPMLESTGSYISYQDQLNEIQAQGNAAMRMASGNPGMLANIAAQIAEAKNKVRAEEFRQNQMRDDEVRRRNISTLNDATLKNLGMKMQQYERQSAAKSATKAQAIGALMSIGEKIGKNKAETLAANTMANMYPQFSWGPQGRIYSTGTTQFNIPTDIGSQTNKDAKGNDLLPVYDKKGQVTGYKVKESRNGSIVKAIKNL